MPAQPAGRRRRSTNASPAPRTMSTPPVTSRGVAAPVPAVPPPPVFGPRVAVGTGAVTWSATVPESAPPSHLTVIVDEPAGAAALIVATTNSPPPLDAGAMVSVALPATGVNTSGAEAAVAQLPLQAARM